VTRSRPGPRNNPGPPSAACSRMGPACVVVRSPRPTGSACAEMPNRFASNSFERVRGPFDFSTSHQLVLDGLCSSRPDGLPSCFR
jgi:hypothetical protein